MNYASQLLLVLEYLHSKEYFHAPGEFNSDRIYFTQMYDNIFLDIGTSISHISVEYLMQDSNTVLNNRKYNVK